ALVALASLGAALRGANSEEASLPWSPDPPRYSVPVRDGNGKTLSLYPPGGPVGVDTGDSLVELLSDPLRGGEKWTLLEIYDYTCPHCWYAVPIFSQVAEAFADSASLEVTSVNCHMHSNMKACFYLQEIGGVEDFPAFLLCPPGSKVISGDIADLPDRATDLVRSFDSEKSADFRDFEQLARCRRRFVEVTVARGREDPFLSATEIATWVSKQTGLKAVHPNALERGADFLDAEPPTATGPPGRPGWLTDDQAGRPGVSAYVPGERWFDALSGFVVLVYQGYKPSKHQATLLVVRYLSTAFPVKGKELADLAFRLEGTKPEAQPSVIQNILSEWSYQVGLGDPASVDADDSHAPEDELTCTHSSTCAMWTLLHVTCTAVAARGFSGRTLIGDESTGAGGESGKVIRSEMSPEKAASDAIQNAQGFVRSFVEHFLNCGECKRNFLIDYDSCNYGRCKYEDYRDLPLWLWRVHNAISLHVAREQHVPVDRRWPMYEDCPACWSGALMMDGLRVLGPLALELTDPVSPTQGRGLRGDYSFEKGHAGSYSASRGEISSGGFTSDELDSPFNTRPIFWHLVRTFIGIRRVVFELDDFTGDERQEVEAVIYEESSKSGEGDRFHDRGHHGDRGPSPDEDPAETAAREKWQQQQQHQLPPYQQQRQHERQQQQHRLIVQQHQERLQELQQQQQQQQQEQRQAHHSRQRVPLEELLPHVPVMPDPATSARIAASQSDPTYASQILLGLLAVALGVASILCYFGGEPDFTYDGEFDDDRSRRAPIIRDPSSILASRQEQEEEDELELVRDIARPTTMDDSHQAMNQAPAMGTEDEMAAE
ncbi:unnamed protein product, partial [Polarella glacialis]